MTVGENIKHIRCKKGFTQKQLGELCDPRIAESTIRRYELGKLNPKIETIQRIATALQVPLRELFYSQENGQIVIDLTGLDINEQITHAANIVNNNDNYKFDKILSTYLQEIGEFLYYNPNHRPLFDSVMEVKTEDVDFANQMLNRINGKIPEYRKDSE